MSSKEQKITKQLELEKLKIVCRGEKASKGIIYVAFGAPYLAMALYSMKTLKAHNRDLPVCLVTNCTADPTLLPYWEEGCDWWLQAEEKNNKNRNYKISVDQITPFDTSLYLDCDTEVLASLEPLFFLLDHFEFVITPTPGAGSQSKLGKVLFSETRDSDETPKWNSGVFGFNLTSNTQIFFEMWRSLYIEKNLKYDQPALAEALITSNMRFAAVDRKWNWVDDRWKFSPRYLRLRKAKILHYMYKIDARLTGALVRNAREAEKRKAVAEGFTTELLGKISSIRRNRFRRLIRKNFAVLSMFRDEVLYTCEMLKNMRYWPRNFLSGILKKPVKLIPGSRFTYRLIKRIRK